MAKQRIKVREHRPETVSPNNQHEEEDFLRENPLLTSPLMEAGGQVGTPPDEDPFGANPFGGGGPGGEAGGIGSGEDQTPWWGDMGPKYGQLMGHVDSPYSTTNGFGSGLYGELGPQIQKQAQQMQMLADSKLRSFTPPSLDITVAGGGIEGKQEAQTDTQQSETLGGQTQADQAAPENAKQEGEKQASQDVKSKDKEKNKKEADQAKDQKDKAAADAQGKEDGDKGGKDPAAKKEGAGKEGGGKDNGGKGKADAKGGDAGGGEKVTPNVAGLPGDIASKLQSVLGMDVSQLKIVSNSSEAVKHGAKAMAKGGNEMHFAPGEFNPNSKEGQFKIGHEGAHLKKQQEGAVKATGEEGGQKVNTDASQEKFADDVGKQMTQDAPANNNAPATPPPTPQAQIKPLGGESVAQFIREGGPDFSGYDSLLNAAESGKSNAQSSLDGQKTSFQSAVDTEKQNIQSTLEGEAQRAKGIVEGGADKLTEVKDGVVSEVETAGEDKLSAVETTTTTETENVNTMVDGKKEELTSLGDTFGSRLESHGEKEAGRMESETNTNTSEVGNAVSSVKGRYANKEGVDDLAGKLENKASDASSKLQEFGSGVAEAVRSDGTSNAEKVRTEAQESADALEGAKEKGTEAIDKKKEDADQAISGNTEQFITSAETESESAISQVQQGSGEIESHIMSMGEGVGEQMDQAANEMGTALDTANQEAMTELDTFLNSLADVGWNAELMGQIAGDVSAALSEHQQQMTSFVEENKGKVTQVSGKLKESTGGVVEQVQSEIDKAAEEFKSGLDTKKSEILSENETIASDTATQMASVKTNMEPEISNTVSEAESNWEENVSEVESDMSEKVDDGLEEEQGVVDDFKSEVESSFEELPEKKEDQGLLGSIWDGIKSVASFIGGVFEGFAMAIVKIFTGLWELLKMLTDPLMLLLAVVAIIVGALILFGIAALAGVTVGTVLLVIGAIFGVGMMAFMFYKAITTEGLSARERGNLVGEGLFEGVTAFLGTGMVARFGKWAGQIGKARHLVNAAGGLPQFMRMAAFVDDIPRLTRMLDAGADMAQLSRLLGNAGDARQAAAIMDLVDTVGDMGQVSKLLDYTQDAGRLMNFFKKGIGPGKLLDAVAASGDAGRVLNALDAVGDTRRLVDLLGRSKNVPGVLNLIENGGDANKVMDLLESIPNKRQLNALVEASGGDVNKLESLINGGENAGDLAAIENTVDAAGDAARVENATDTASDAGKVENATDAASDAGKVENATDAASDAGKVENATDTASDAGKVENATDTASDAGKVDETTDATKVDDVESGPKPETLSDANSAAYDRLQNAGLKPRNNGGNVEFLSAEGKVVAEITDGNLVFKYEGYGGDIVMDPNKTTTFLGKFVENPESPLTGTRYFLGSEKGGIPGLPEGSFSRGAGKAPNNNGLNSLDIPEDEYMRIINKHLDEQRNLPENAGLSPKELEAKGWEAGNNEFWDLYNEPFLEDAFIRGDNVRLISDPATQSTGTYARELAAIQGPNGLAAKYGYVWDPSLSSYVKGGSGAPTPGVLDNVAGMGNDVAKVENATDIGSDAAKVENAVDGGNDAARVDDVSDATKTENAADTANDATNSTSNKSSNPEDNNGMSQMPPGGQNIKYNGENMHKIANDPEKFWSDLGWGDESAEEIARLAKLELMSSTQDVRQVGRALKKLGAREVTPDDVARIKQYLFGENTPIGFYRENYDAWRRLAKGEGTIGDARFLVHENAEIKRMMEMGEHMDFDPTGGSLGKYSSRDQFDSNWNRMYDAAHQEALVHEYTWLAQQYKNITGLDISMPQMAVADIDRLGNTIPTNFNRLDDFDYVNNMPSFEGVNLHQHQHFDNWIAKAQRNVTVTQEVATKLGLSGVEIPLYQLVAAVRTYKP